MSNNKPKRAPLDFELIRERAKGLYVSRIYPSIGIELEGNGKVHQPCPLCGGKDRFRCDDKGGSGSWICNQCGAGNGLKLIMAYTNCDSYDAHALIADTLGIDGGIPVTDAQRKAWREQQIKREQDDAQAKKEARRHAAERAQVRFGDAKPCTEHPYLSKKGVNSHGLRADDRGNLLIPLYYHSTETGNITLCNVQSISQDGIKLYIKDALVGGAFFTVGDVADADVIFACEGYATGASIYESMDGRYPVIITFDAGNMVKCAPILRKLYPHQRLIFCADDDHATEIKTGDNTGIIKATESARIAHGEMIYPDFGDDARRATGELTDYNDLHNAIGIGALKAQMTHAINHPKQPPADDATDNQPLADILGRYAVIRDIGKITNKVYDLSTHTEMTKTQFIGIVGKELANAWFACGDQQYIDRKEVRERHDRQVAQEYANMFEQYYYIRATKDVYNLKTRERQPIETLRLEYPTEYEHWLKSDNRKMVDLHNIWFDPSGTKRPKDGGDYINTYTGLNITPITADEIGMSDAHINEPMLLSMCLPIYNLLEHLCGDDQHALDWVINWLAIPLQRPGTKLDTALIVHGHIQGAGKSLLFDRIMSRIYGDYLLTLGQGQLDSQYNDWVEGKLFAVFEEIFQGRDRYSNMGMIKQLITGSNIYINKKFMSGWTADNHVNTIFLSNELQPLSLDETDRRHVVLYPKSTIPESIRDELEQALADPKQLMIRAFYTYLLIKDTGEQHEHSTAIETSAKKRLQTLSMASWERFYHAWANGELEVRYSSCLSADLYDYYTYWCGRNGERSTSSTKFLTFVGLREHKARVRYKLVGAHPDMQSIQASAILLERHKNLDQNALGVCFSNFKSAIMGARGQGSHSDDDPF